VSQLPEAVDEALAGLTVGPPCLQHGLALFHKLEEHKHGIPALKLSTCHKEVVEATNVISMNN